MKELDKKTPESFRFYSYLTDRKSYPGCSERIEGLNRVAQAIGEIANIRTVEPMILSAKLYDEYAAHRPSSRVIENYATEIWDRLLGNQYPLIVRRLFPDQEGKTKTGPRSGNIKSTGDLIKEIGKLYDFFAANYNPAEVSPEIMVHRVVDVGNPPRQEEPFLPWPGGDVTPIGNHTYQVRATFGADESVQGFPCDMWIVKYNPDGSIMISQPVKALKTHSKVPAIGEYRRIEIPENAQTIPTLNHRQVVSLTDVAKNLEDQYGGHRLEFDGTIINDQKILVIIEADPFKKYANSYESLRPFGDNITRPLNLIKTINDVENLQPSGDLDVVHLAPQMFQGNELRVALTDLGFRAKAEGIPLAVLASGNIATQHAIRNIIDNGHSSVWFTGNEQFESGEKIRFFKMLNGDYNWEREDPIVYQERIRNRGVERIGGKAQGLQQLEANGFRTSPYFVLETSLFRRIIDDLGLNEEFSRLDLLSPTDRYEHIDNLTRSIAKKIINYEGTQIPDLGYALAKIGGHHFSVRSSTTLEDGRIPFKRTSFAGVFKSKLSVEANGLHEAILKVMASIVNPLAIKGALTANLRPSEASIAIIVQRMVNARAAGTIFTKEHLTNDESVLKIEAVRGLGNRVVDGTAEYAQQILVRKETGRIIDNTFPRSGAILNRNLIGQLVALGKAVEKVLGEGPQDIEWAIDRKGIVLLQTRPL